MLWAVSLSPSTILVEAPAPNMMMRSWQGWLGLAEVMRVGPLWTASLPTRALSRAQMRTQLEDDCQQARKLGLPRNQICQRLHLDFQPPELRGINRFCFSCPVCGILVQQPELPKPGGLVLQGISLSYNPVLVPPNKVCCVLLPLVALYFLWSP